MKKGESGRVLQGVISRASFRRQPRGGKSFFTVMSLHINNNCVKKCCIGEKLLRTIRAVMPEEHVDLVSVDFNGAVVGPGAAPGEWADVCGFLKHLDSYERWKVRQLLHSLRHSGPPSKG